MIVHVTMSSTGFMPAYFTLQPQWMLYYLQACVIIHYRPKFNYNLFNFFGTGCEKGQYLYNREILQHKTTTKLLIFVFFFDFKR